MSGQTYTVVPNPKHSAGQTYTVITRPIDRALKTVRKKEVSKTSKLKP